MTYQIATIATTIFAGVALILNYFLFKRGLEQQQANLLTELITKNLTFLEKQKEYEEKGRLGEFFVIFLNQLELIAYLINNNYIPFRMSNIYQGFIKGWHQRVLVDQKDKFKKYHIPQPEAFKEIKKLCKKYEEIEKINSK